MADIPESLFQAWDLRDGPAVLATVNPDGAPNVIYVSYVKRFEEDKMVVADTYFHKTRDNIRQHAKAALLFITRDGESWQIKGDVEYHTAGPVFEDIRQTWILPAEPIAAMVLNIRQVFRQSKQLM
jgi:uncharacterized protein